MLGLIWMQIVGTVIVTLKDFFALFKIECLFLEAFKGQVKQMIQTFSPNVGLQKLSNYLS